MPYTIQGKSPPLPRDPVEINGTVYVPLEDIVLVLAGEVARDENEATATAEIAPWSAAITTGANTANVNGTEVTFSGPVVDEDGSLWVPADFFQAAFGYDVSVDGLKVAVTNPNAPE